MGNGPKIGDKAGSMEFEPGTALPRPSAGAILEFEAYNQLQLPQALKDLWTTGHGAVPKENAFYQGARERMIERFLVLLDDPGSSGEIGWYDISVVVTQIGDRLVEDEDLVGTDVVPFAVLFAGDYVCLSYKDVDVGEPSVVVWDHEQSEVGAPYLETVAKNLDEFLTMLKPAAP